MALVTLVLLQLFVVAAGAHLLTSDELSEKAPKPVASAEPPPPVPVITAGPVLAARGNGPLPAKGTLAAKLTEALGDPALGDSVGAAVVDVETGALLFGSGAETGVTPASTTKVATSVAALASLGPDATISTRVVRGPTSKSITLVGGGDPTLSARKTSGVYPQPASLAALAMRTARALKATGITTVNVTYDDGLYTGPRTAPTWKPGYVPEGSVAPVTALAIDEGKVAPGSHQRVSDPSRTAYTTFVSLLSKYGVKAVKVARARVRAAKESQEIARVDSAPVYALVERALTLSDNDLTEALARQVAIKEGRPASFEGAAQAVLGVLGRLKLAQGVRVFDGCGLSPKNRIAPAALARLVAVATSPANPHLHSVISGMPVAGFTGTLGHRFVKDDSVHGLIRAKTGTLDGVNALAGTTVTRGGRLVTFAFMADKVPPGWGKAEAALDRLAAIVAAG
ncbi:D-alanyl-D-alanine carboxypeptidase/D-alanyl-D-alanine-endopeptidase [Streptosporangium sp. NPDC001559]|uniref:D-alanyl-D-alanine carboxypeptidase/D-alanyl-D-alanine endopeptidase n=1 Tax=Streptosporangium sp. NPDC001559 TaxID=3366187 RepID=UPI0036F0E402